MNIGFSNKTEYVSVPRVFFEELLCGGTLEQIRVYMAFLSAGNNETVDDVCRLLNMTKDDLVDVLTALKEKGLVDFEYSGGDIALNYVLSTAVRGQNKKPSRIIGMAEEIKGMPLSTSECSMVYFLKDSLLFSDELIEYLLKMAAERDAFSAKYIKKVALSWADTGIKELKDVPLTEPVDRAFVAKVLKALGRNEASTPSEERYVKKWLSDYDMPRDVILYACDLASIRVSKNRLLYADRVLCIWHENGVKTLDKAKAFRLEENTASKAKSKEIGAFNSFEQNTYDFAELEKQLLDN